MTQNMNCKNKYELTDEQAFNVIRNIRLKIQQYFRENNLTYAIFGKSEGLDSSVIAGLLSNLKGVKPIGVIMPCESDPESEHIAKLVLNHFQIPYISVDLSQEFHFLMGQLYSMDGIHGQLANILKHYNDSSQLKIIPYRKSKATGNIKARLRMVNLYHIAQLTNGLVVSTDNLSEHWMGFWTLNGDVGDIAPIQHIWKGMEEYTIAKVLEVPEESINAIPTDGLDITPGGIDQDQLGLPYHDLDRVIVALLQHKFDCNLQQTDIEFNSLVNNLSQKLGYEEPNIAHVAQQMKNTHYKRNWPHVFTRFELGLPSIDEIDISKIREEDIQC